MDEVILFGSALKLGKNKETCTKRDNLFVWVSLFFQKQLSFYVRFRTKRVVPECALTKIGSSFSPKTLEKCFKKWFNAIVRMNSKARQNINFLNDG